MEQSVLERLMTNNMLLSKDHAEDLKIQIEDAIEHCGEKELYDVKLIKKKSGYQVQVCVFQMNEEVSKADSNGKNSAKIIKLKRVI